MANAINFEEILDAVIFAAQKHQGHIRKNHQGLPYITHPLTVAREIDTIGQLHDQDILIAAILHDTIEDTQTTQHEIREFFGEHVLMIVLEVTDDKSLPRQQRKQLQVIHAAQLSYPAKIIKLADKLVNCRDILESPPKDWSLDRRRDYIQWAADVVAQIRGTNLPLESAFDIILAEAESKLAFHLEPFETVSDRPWGTVYPNK